MPGRVLIVEDEVDLAATMEYSLTREGYQVSVAHTGAAALAAALAEPGPDVIVLDLMLPDLPGTEVCRRLREHDRTRDLPIVMCTAKDTEIDRVVGFEVGADDYVVKPFSVRELGLRVRALLRRSQRVDAEAESLRFGRLRVDRDAHRVWIDDQEVVLTALEFRLLYTFLSRKGRVQSREALLADVWGIEAEVTTRTVDTHVKRLREKLGEVGDYIETLRGVGYRFRAEPDEA
ncbi:MAG: response regulator transcription factor [Kofleriaceae bacterium]|jgi:two-component system phosphate regulon response regulator PhoB|nr:response regulator transcription factor [Kofleriaceae bacterium]MBP9169590.1 response regulator transcription factor [Kofleriaceae bacterium]MBP9858599.1 response regulator transcription factor [Kofleriaceae bacterium]